MKGYKIMDPDMTCLGFQYEIGETYTMEDTPSLGSGVGFHYCFRWQDLFWQRCRKGCRVFKIEVPEGVLIDSERGDPNAAAQAITIVEEVCIDSIAQDIYDDWDLFGHVFLANNGYFWERLYEKGAPEVLGALAAQGYKTDEILDNPQDVGIKIWYMHFGGDPTRYLNDEDSYVKRLAHEKCKHKEGL